MVFRNLFSPYERGASHAEVFSPADFWNRVDVIAETELTLLQFYVSWEIIVSWAAANDYWELIVCDV